jgi:ubiquinone/menaquinone biosynthesis C-methylase UbiE
MNLKPREDNLCNDPSSSAFDAARTVNRHVWDRMAASGEPLCTPAKPDELADPLATVDPLGWLGGDIRGWRVLCLAAGGGRHSALYAAAGAKVTVVDLSPGMLALDRQVAREYGLEMTVIEASMDHLPMLADATFDLVVHPVSTCYLPDVAGVFGEVARLVRPAGLYISQHKQPHSLQSATSVDAQGRYSVNHAYYRITPIPEPKERNATAARLREAGAQEYLHRWEQLIGGICRAGFVIEDLIEPLHAKPDPAVGTFEHRASFIPPYVRIKARRKAGSTTALWLPQSH